ncbi:MAG: phosphoglycerol geranylgeranyltransferase [Candidatus Thalassarchaeaceae archaeon]|jgi:phosphoglycerol geranylgeranyltransferase|nr:phosphoglycerol geranylgeranyltransferase [Candidatus Thalassarchaeaceae archaeon]MDP6703208.1 phosphoglycerol geranylgeranyltransferase [Candidatus Thalassarchaeaceae archaeon]MDP7003979.1 phosphoglycerol geranylgeranyltransferase [Candidatus Thalassarchaeaceae archaeon]
MTDAERPVADLICDRTQPTRHAILIDPAGQSPEVAAKRAIAAVTAGSKMILVGGSSDTDGANVNATVLAIKEGLELVSWATSQDSGGGNENWRAPVVLFPQGSSALSPAADAITFMMLMNSTDPRFLIGEQTLGAPFVKKASIEPIPMGYVICAPGGKAGEVGKADLILNNETERVAALAMAAECFGFNLFYLEAGSGAATPVDPNLIRTARASCDLTLVVGGGIRDEKTARAAAEAGADWIITGNIAEEFDNADELQRTLAALIRGMSAQS